MIRAWVLVFVFAGTKVAVADAVRDCARGGSEAIAACTEALRSYPDESTLYYNRAGAYIDTGLDTDNIVHAISDYTNAIKIDPKYGLAYTRRGDMYRISGDNDHAIADYTKAIAIYPENAVAYANRGLAYNAKGDLDRAIADYSKTIEIDRPESDRDHDPTKTIELYPEYSTAYDNRGTAYGSKGDFDRAVADYTKVIEMKPRYAVGYANRGSARAAKGDLNPAIADYTKAIEIDPGLIIVYFKRGATYEARGDKELAIADYRKYLTFNPTDGRTKDALLRLKATH